MRSAIKTLSIFTMCSVAVSLCLLLSLPACDSQPCDEAQQKLESCVEKVNCNTADPMEIDTCRKAVQQAEDLLKEMEGAPCVLEIKDRAENYANCPVDPVTYCQC